MGSRVVPTTATPGPWWFSTNDGTGRSTVRSQTIVVSASLQRGRASKERKMNNTEVTPQRACHRPSHTVRGFFATQAGYQWQLPIAGEYKLHTRLQIPEDMNADCHV